MNKLPHKHTYKNGKYMYKELTTFVTLLSLFGKDSENQFIWLGEIVVYFFLCISPKWQSLYSGGLFGYPDYQGYQGGDQPLWRQARASTSSASGEAKVVARSLERKMSLSGPADMGGFDQPTISVTSVM